MFSVTFTVSPKLTESLTTIDKIRTTILLTPISPLTEARLRWQSSRLLHLDENQRMAFGSLRNDWVAQNKPITVITLETLVETIFPRTKGTLLRALRKEEYEMKRLLTYLSAQKDHPVIQAGLLFASFSEFELASVDSIPSIVSGISLASTWYDCRGMLAAPNITERAGDVMARYGQLTVWLEAFTKEMIINYETLVQTITTIHSAPPPPAWNLTNRHKRILSLFENPKATVTNRDIQRLFHVSQVTASRDLAHLTSLGLLYAHGKGRSVYYTRL